MKTIKQEFINWILLIIPIIYIAINWEKFPAQVPIHFNFDGEPNNYASKIVGLILLPGINVFTYILLLITPYIDPRKSNYALFISKYTIIRTLLHLFLCEIILLVCYYSLGNKINISVIGTYSVIAMFLIVGNYLGNLRSNYFIGIRVPWTLESEEVWNLTHRFAGKLWVGLSIVALIAVYLLPPNKIILPTYIFVIAGLPIIYSYLKFKSINSSKIK